MVKFLASPDKPVTPVVYACFYDRDPKGKRLNRNAKIIRDHVKNFELCLEPVNRIRPFCNEQYLEKLLLDGAFDGTIINAFSPESETAIAVSRAWTELLGLPPERIILLCCPKEQYIHPGVQYVPCSGGNGYIQPGDAKSVIEKLSRFYRR